MWWKMLTWEGAAHAQYRHRTQAVQYSCPGAMSRMQFTPKLYNPHPHPVHSSRPATGPCPAAMPHMRFGPRSRIAYAAGASQMHPAVGSRLACCQHLITMFRSWSAPRMRPAPCSRVPHAAFRALQPCPRMWPNPRSHVPHLACAQ